MIESLQNMEVELERPYTGIKPRLGERLVESGIINQQQLQQALEVQTRSSAFLGQIIVDLGFVGAGTIGAMLAQDFGVRYVDLLTTQPDQEAMDLVSEE